MRSSCRRVMERATSLLHSRFPLLRHTASLPDAHVRVVSLSSEGDRAAHSPDFSDLKGPNQKCSTAMNRCGNSKLSASRDPILCARGRQTGERHLYAVCCLAKGVPPSQVEPPRISGGSTPAPPRGNGHLLPLRAPQARCDQRLPRHTSYLWLVPFSIPEKYVFLSPEQGARSQLYAATALEVEEKD
ncbi:hypothetical protein B0H14DRAFT_3870637 [Mycena olivaceomarginata]|nr:hypothetical protein B0H14DRAFT_3870637 [Mycena olivaceomarginata]